VRAARQSGTDEGSLPTIVKGLGYSASEAQLYTVRRPSGGETDEAGPALRGRVRPRELLGPSDPHSFVLVLLSAFALDHYQTRGLPIACFYLVSAVGCA